MVQFPNELRIKGQILLPLHQVTSGIGVLQDLRTTSQKPVSGDLEFKSISGKPAIRVMGVLLFTLAAYFSEV